MIKIEIGNLLTRKYPGVEINVADNQICKIAAIVCYFVLLLLSTICLCMSFV